MEILRVGDPRLATIQRMKNQFAAETAERIMNAMFTPDATLLKGDSFTLNSKLVMRSAITAPEFDNGAATILLANLHTEAAKERLIEEYRQGGGVSCMLHYTNGGRLVLTLTVNDRNGDTLFFVGPKEIALGAPIVKKPIKKKRKYVRKGKPAAKKEA